MRSSDRPIGKRENISNGAASVGGLRRSAVIGTASSIRGVPACYWKSSQSFGDPEGSTYAGTGCDDETASASTSKGIPQPADPASQSDRPKPARKLGYGAGRD